MTNPICPPRPPARLNVENLSIVNRSTTTIQLNAKCVEKVVFKSMELVQDEDRISAIKFNFSVIYTVHTYENLKGIYQKNWRKNTY